jgi:hypothetical protein
LRREKPECFIVSDLEISDELRLGQPETRALMDALDKDYRKQEFRPLTAWPDLLGPGNPPEDWLYPAPTLLIYQRRS